MYVVLSASVISMVFVWMVQAANMSSKHNTSLFIKVFTITKYNMEESVSINIYKNNIKAGTFFKKGN